MKNSPKIFFITFGVILLGLLLFLGKQFLNLEEIGARILSYGGDEKKLEKNNNQEGTFIVSSGLVGKLIEFDDAVVTSTENLNLAFNSPGKVDKIFANEGEEVKEGDLLMKLETTELDLQMKVLEASLKRAQANLDKLLAGATTESVQIYKSEIAAIKNSIVEQKKTLAELIISSYTVGEDAVRGKTNSFFNNPNSSNPQLVISIGDSSLEDDIESRREKLEETLNEWEDDVDDLDESDNLGDAIDDVKDDMDEVRTYLEKVALFANQITASGSGLDQDTIDDWNLAVSTARSNVDLAIINIKEANLSLSGIEGKKDVAQESLNFINAAARKEDVAAAQAELDSLTGQIKIMNHRLEEAELRAPTDGMVMKNLFKESEVIPLGQVTVILSRNKKKIEADVFEEEIPKVKVGNSVEVQIRALPNKNIEAKVTAIKPQPIIKNGDVYYRVDIELDDDIENLMEGMTADIWISAGEKKQALKIPNEYIIKSGTNNYVNIFKNNSEEERAVDIGYADYEFTEVLRGVKEGDILLMPKF